MMMATPHNNGWHGDFQRLEERMNEKFGALAVQIERIDAKIVNRTEIDADLNRRVSTESYQADVRNVNDRLARLESGPQRSLGWISLVISGGVGCLSFLMAAAGLITTIIIATHR